MATSLSKAQVLAVFQILDVQFATSFNTLDGMGVLTSQTDVSGSTQSAAKTEIDTALSNLGTNDVLLETELKTLVDRWITIGTKTTSIEGGAIGDVTGLEFNFERERNLLRDRVQLILPFYKNHEVIARRMAADSANIPIV